MYPEIAVVRSEGGGGGGASAAVCAALSAPKQSMAHNTARQDRDADVKAQECSECYIMESWLVNVPAFLV